MKSTWEQPKLGQLTIIQSGFAFRSKDYTDSGHFLIRIGNVQDGYISLHRPKYVNLSEKTVRFALNVGDFLISLTGNIGRVAKIQPSDLPAALNQRVARLTVVKTTRLSSDYLYYFLSSSLFSDELSNKGHGAAQQNVSSRIINEIPIPLPPLTEQKRIVEILDEAFAAIDKAIANTEKNIRNAEELFESELNRILQISSSSSSGQNSGDVVMPEKGWPIFSLGELADKVDYGLTASATFSANGPKFLRITDIQKGLVDWSSVPVCKCTPDNEDKYRLDSGDIVFARTGATTGKSYLITSCPPNSIFASYLIRVRPSGTIDSPYLAYFFQTASYWEQVTRSSSGSAQPGVNATKLKNLRIPLPPLTEQKRIVAELDKLSGKKQLLVETYEHKQIALTALKRSILHKAFTGELTADFKVVDKALSEAGV